MRLFTGLDIPEHVRSNLEKTLQALRPAADVKWSPVANLHITTKFIGEWPDGRLEELKGALSKLTRREPVVIRIQGVGWFPNARSPRVFFVDVNAPPALADLVRETDHALGRLGVPTEDREFSPHLTLARIKQPVNLDRLREAVDGLVSTDFGSFEADRFYLYESRTRPSGSEYSKLAEFPLGA